jgi:hypothetical protein
MEPPDYVFCLNGGAYDFNTLWLNTSLRSYVEIDVEVKVAKEPTCSGKFGGIVPDPFRILR